MGIIPLIFFKETYHQYFIVDLPKHQTLKYIIMATIELNTITDIAVTGEETKNQIKFPFNDFEESFTGKPISLPFAKELVNATGWLDLETTKTTAVSFSSKAILLLLSQKGCEGIRCYFAIKKNGVETIVLIGTDTDGNDLGVTVPTGVKNGHYESMITNESSEAHSIIVEVGGTCNLTPGGLDLNDVT